MKGTLVILSGPAAVGKDTLIEKWEQADRRVKRVVAYTTRNRAPDEVDGRDYHFVTESKFKELIEADFFLEWKPVHEHYYGTPKQDTQDLLDDGKIAILKIDVKGALEVMSKRPDAVAIFIDPPSLEVLEDRIRKRARPGDNVELRLRNALDEIAMAGRYQHRVVNETDKAEDAVARLQEIVEEAERIRDSIPLNRP